MAAILTRNHMVAPHDKAEIDCKRESRERLGANFQCDGHIIAGEIAAGGEIVGNMAKIEERGGTLMVLANASGYVRVMWDDVHICHVPSTAAARRDPLVTALFGSGARAAK